MLRMDQVHVIRHKVLVEGQSIRRVAPAMCVSRNTVRKYLKVSEPVRVETKARARPTLAKVAPRIEELLREWVPRTTSKQRITGSRVHRQLVEEGHEVGVTTVREYLREGHEVGVTTVREYLREGHEVVTTVRSTYERRRQQTRSPRDTARSPRTDLRDTADLLSPSEVGDTVELADTISKGHC